MQHLDVRGVSVPAVGLGTWNLRGRQAEQAIETALEMGYRHLDTAEIYRNESEIGRALATSDVPREDLFITSKVWSNHFAEEAVVSACAASLERLATAYLDLYLIHWPSDDVPIEETMAGMHRVVEQGLARQVGVSNFSTAQVEAAEAATPARVFCNQVKFHVGHPRASEVAHAAEQGYFIQAYTPLAKGRLKSNSTLHAIAGSHGKTALQVAMRWLLQQGPVAVIPKASSREHQLENFQLFDFVLSDEEMAQISAL